MAAATRPGLDASPSIALCELGPLGVEVDGDWFAVRGARMSALLAALVVAARREVGTDELVEMIWPSPGQPPTARQSLANLVRRLRTSYGAAFVESTRRGYRLGDDVTSDRERFLADVDHAGALVAHEPQGAFDLIGSALERWRGEPWYGLERPVGVEADRAHLLQLRTDGLRVRVTALFGLNRPALALVDLRELLDTDPYDEFSRFHLVRILADSGQRAEALRIIQEGHRAFSQRGLTLDAALVELEQLLLSSAHSSHAEMDGLPEQPTDFVGREREIEAIVGALQIDRLVVLHGIGGSGKTRLAVQAASTIDEAGEVGFVELAGTRSSSQVELAFARGLGVPVSRLVALDTAERRKALTDAAAASAGVLVIDNCEHVLDDVRPIVGAVLAQPGQLRMLATSRLPLEIAGERRFPIPEFTQGVELFRRRSAHLGVPLETEQHADAVVTVCELVDQLPLAIEIAAAQTPYRTVPEIVAELERGIVLRDAAQPEARHQTMSAAIRWSHELLDSETAKALIRLGVFDGPFEQNDAAAMIEEGDSRRILDTLVRASLAERTDHAGRSTYRLSVPVQQYCSAELERRGATTNASVSLADWLLEFTDRPYGDVLWRFSVVDEIAPRFSYALSAIDGLCTVGRTDDATRLAGRLGGVAHLYSRADELIDVLGDLWPKCLDADASADALVALVLCTNVVNRVELFGPALRVLGALDGPAGRRNRVYACCMNSLVLMWTARLTDADYGPANDELDRARTLDDALSSPIDSAHIEDFQSALHLLAGDWSAAEAAARRSLESSAGTIADVAATSSLCHARLQLGDPDTALRLATSHPHRNVETAFGDRLGLVAAIARVQSGDIDGGLAEIAKIQRRVRSTVIQQVDAAIAIAYIAHLLDDDDLTMQILDTGALGFGPWLGFLVPKICRDMQIPVTGEWPRSDAVRRSRSDLSGATASRALDELMRRWSTRRESGTS